jgi:hypothetical protein
MRLRSAESKIAVVNDFLAPIRVVLNIMRKIFGYAFGLGAVNRAEETCRWQAVFGRRRGRVEPRLSRERQPNLRWRRKWIRAAAQPTSSKWSPGERRGGQQGGASRLQGLQSDATPPDASPLPRVDLLFNMRPLQFEPRMIALVGFFQRRDQNVRQAAST